MSVKCSKCGLVSFADNETCRRCGTPLEMGGWGPQPSYPGSVVDSTPSYGGGPGGEQPPQSWGAAPDGSNYGQAGGGYGNQADGYGGQAGGYGDGYGNQAGGYGDGYGNQAGGYNGQVYGGTYGTYSPPFSPQGGYGYAPAFGYGGQARPYELAERGTRLLAAIVDNLCFGGPVLAFVLLGAAMGKGAGIILILLGILCALVVLVIQIVMLCQRGQTIGKRMMGIRIVKMDTGENGGGLTNVVLRGIVPGVIGAVPYVGPVFSIVNICFIFAADRRCVHDHIAGTVVVQGDP